MKDKKVENLIPTLSSVTSLPYEGIFNHLMLEHVEEH